MEKMNELDFVILKKIEKLNVLKMFDATINIRIFGQNLVKFVSFGLFLDFQGKVIIFEFFDSCWNQ